MNISEMSNSSQLKYYEEKLAIREKKENLRDKLEQALDREQNFNAFAKAKKIFSFPFKNEAFGALFDAILFLGATLIFSVCAFFVLWAVLFCAIVDFIYIILFGLAYPFVLLYFAIFKKQRIEKLKKKLNKVKNSLSGMPEKEELQNKIRSLNKTQTSTHTDSSNSSASYSSSSGIESTDYYKNKKDEYYRLYMGFPPKEESSLSSLSTDTTLDLHPGDY